LGFIGDLRFPFADYAGVVRFNILCGSVSKKSDFHLGLTPSVRREVPEDKGKHANGKKESPNHNNING
jgi:hypothetical protein